LVIAIDKFSINPRSWLDGVDGAVNSTLWGLELVASNTIFREPIVGSVAEGGEAGDHVTVTPAGAEYVHARPAAMGGGDSMMVPLFVMVPLIYYYPSSLFVAGRRQLPNRICNVTLARISAQPEWRAW
jgi:hypothetical protein